MATELATWLSSKWVTSYRLNKFRTAAYAVVRPAKATRVILILGCQRSGTTMLANLLGLSPLVRVYGEGDPKYFRQDGSRQFHPQEDLAKLLSCEKSPFTMLKPLCESQRAEVLLDDLPGSKALWIFRNYRECVASHLKYYREFHDGVEYIRELLNGDTLCWKNENVSANMLTYLRSFKDQPINAATAYALYWLARNSLYWSVAQSQRVQLVNYERIVSHPTLEVQRVFQFLGVPYRERFVRLVGRGRSISKELGIDREVAQRCEEMHQRLLGCLPATT